MNALNQKSDIELAKDLLKIIEDRKEIEKKEKELKSYFRTQFESLGIDTATIGKVLISMVSKTRTGLDQKALIAKLGKEFVAQFVAETPYTQVDVKKANEDIGQKVA